MARPARPARWSSRGRAIEIREAERDRLKTEKARGVTFQAAAEQSSPAQRDVAQSQASTAVAEHARDLRLSRNRQPIGRGDWQRRRDADTRRDLV